MNQPKAVSSTFGKIKHVLLIFWEYLLPPLEDKCPDEQRRLIEEKVLEYYEPLITQLNLHRDGKELYFDFLIEHKVTLHHDKKRQGLGLSNGLWLFPKTDAEAANPEPVPTILRANQGFTQKNGYEVRFIYTNIDFDEVAREAMRALDFDSNFLSIGNVKELFQSIQDPFIPLNHHGLVIILEPFFSWPTLKGFPSPFNFKFVPEVLSSQTEMLIKSFPFYAQGGNILIGDDFVLMGGDIVNKNIVAFQGVSKKATEKKKCGELTKDNFPDLFASFLGLRKGYIVDGSGQSTLGSFQLAAPETVRDNPSELFHLDTFLTIGCKENGQQTLLLAEIYVWDGEGWTEHVSCENNPRLRILRGYLEGCKSQLECYGFHVKRIPMMYFNGQFFSYNNCIVEVFRSGILCCPVRRAYIPKYYFCKLDDHIENDGGRSSPDFKRADELAQCAFKEANLEPILVDMHFRTFAHSRVGLHCMTSVLARY